MPDSGGWVLIDHVCRHCFGRLVQRGDAVRCADCEAEVVGTHTDLCACGARLHNGKDAGLRCQRNPAMGPEQPAAVVVVYVEVVTCRG